MALTKTPVELSSTPSIVDGGNATAITIDSSENVLVGTTDVNPSDNGASGDAGHAIAASGYLASARSDDTVALFNRMDSDGDVVDFRKNGNIIGKLGVEASNNFYIADNTAGVGLNFKEFINPCDSTGQSSRDNFDLGHSTQGRLRDIYLGGGLLVGGTTSANKLDDYEEGTFTPAIAGVSGTFSGDYTKIGDLVTFCIICTGMSGTASASLVTGLPFTAANNNRNYAVAFGNTNLLNTAGQSGQQYFTGFVVPNSTTVQIDTGKVGVANNRSNLAVGNSNIILEFSGSYKV